MPLRMHPKNAALHVLHALEFASEASEGRMGFTFDRDDWDSTSIGWRIQSLCRVKHQASADCVSALSHDRYRLEYIVQLCEALKVSALNLLEIHENALAPIVSKLSKGIATLPNELLALIFKYATLDEHEGTRHAMMLSHVSRRFRQIVIEDRGLWSTLFAWYDTTKEGIQSCIDRTQDDTDLHLVLNRNTDLGISASCDFVEHCLAYASRWKSLTLIGDGEEWDDGTVGELLNEVMAEFGLELPRLHELCFIEQLRNNVRRLPWLTRDTDFEYDAWGAPNVRVLRCSEYVPPRSLPFESLTSFTLNLTLSCGNAVDQIMHLRAFLSWTENLSEMDVQLVNMTNDEDVLTVNDTVSLPSLTSFRFSLLRFYTPQALHRLPDPFLKMLEMSNLEDFSLSTGLPRLPENLIPDPIVHPRIATFTVEARQLNPLMGYIQWEDNFDVLYIPLHKIPNVSSLSVTTTLSKVVFRRQQNLDQCRLGQDGNCLRVLTLKSCCNMDVYGLRGVVTSSKDVGAWNGLERVNIRSCGLLAYDAVAKVFEKEKKCFWMS